MLGKIGHKGSERKSIGLRFRESDFETAVRFLDDGGAFNWQKTNIGSRRRDLKVLGREELFCANTRNQNE